MNTPAILSADGNRVAAPLRKNGNGLAAVGIWAKIDSDWELEQIIDLPDVEGGLWQNYYVTGLCLKGDSLLVGSYMGGGVRLYQPTGLAWTLVDTFDFPSGGGADGQAGGWIDAGAWMEMFRIAIASIYWDDNESLYHSIVTVWDWINDGGGLHHWESCRAVDYTDPQRVARFKVSFNGPFILAVGDPTWNDDRGAVRIYTADMALAPDTVWTQVQEIIPGPPPCADSGVRFGTSISFDNDYLAVGCRANAYVEPDSGCLFIFLWNGQNCDLVATFDDPQAGPDPQANPHLADQFATGVQVCLRQPYWGYPYCVAADPNRAPGREGSVETNNGAIFIAKVNPETGKWEPAQLLTDTGGWSYSSVALNRNGEVFFYDNGQQNLLVYGLLDVEPPGPWPGPWECCSAFGQGQYGPCTPYGNCLTGADTEPPYLQNLDPPSGATGVNIHTDVSMEIVDDGSGVNPDTVVITIGGILAWSADAAQPGFQGQKSIVPKGFRYVLTPAAPFGLGQTVEVHVVATDMADPTLDTTYSFETAGFAPPFLRNRNPFPFQTGVGLSPTISADILDDEGVVASTIDAYVDGALAYDGAAAAFVAPFSGSLVPTTVDGYSGYHIALSRSTLFQPSTTAVIRMVARDADAMVMDETWRFRIGTILLRLDQGPYEITLDAEFSSPMLLSTLLDASQYRFSGGVYTRYVEPLPPGSTTPTGARLWVERFQGENPFTLTVSPLVRDSYGDILASEGRTAQITPFQSSAFFSNTDGLVRSWHESRLVMKDSLRAYLTDIRGLDVFDVAQGLSSPLRWAQVLDAYGVGAACLSSMGDYVFHDTVPPFLAGRVPAPGAIGVPQGTDIRLSVADETTATEITTLVIYVNGFLAFSGVSGWGLFPGDPPAWWGGHISVGRQILNVYLRPPAGAIVVGLNTVAVLATDLAGNLLDTSYTFTVGAGPVVLGGFGTEDFGIDPFGT